MDLQAFLARTAHDLAAPCRQMNSMAQLLADDPDLTDAQKGLVNMLSDIGNKGVSRVDCLRSFANGIDVGDIEKQFVLSDVLQDMLKEHEGLTLSGADGVQLDLMANREAVAKILSVIADNAVKFTPEGESTELTVSMEQAEATVLRFSSGSIGVSLDDLDKLIAPFTKDPVAESYEGFGMGLTIASYLADQAKGKLSVECGEDKVFTVVWQLANAQLLGAQSEAA